MPVLSTSQRKVLEAACLDGRRKSEQAVRAALISLAVTAERVPLHLSPDERRVRNGLRAKGRQLGDQGDDLELLVAECAYEQWHRLLFARVLAECGLLIHPEYETRLTIEDCDELAESLGEPDGWSVAARFAAEILPGIFRLDDPCVQLPLAPEGRLALEEIVSRVPADIFTADDALGWVYQFWQKDKKDEVNRSERKIDGADLGPVTQLFTENYMVRFLLENSLGAWWAARHPDCPLLKDWEYLRYDDDGRPAAGSFDGWPDTVAEVTVMDPCCGSGHFLVEAFGMLWNMRVEEEGIDPIAAQDAVLRDNLFGLEVDPRCVQIAMFAVALQAWKAGGGWRELPVPNVACSGIPVKTPVEEWRVIAERDAHVEDALLRLHRIFHDADTFGSLIDPKKMAKAANPKQAQLTLGDPDWSEVYPNLERLLCRESEDPSAVVLGHDAAALSRSADFLTRKYTLVATNVPWLKRGNQGPLLREYCDYLHSAAKADLATTFVDRWLLEAGSGVTVAVVTPQSWLAAGSYVVFRSQILKRTDLRLAARLGPGAFATITGEAVNPLLLVATRARGGAIYYSLDLSDQASIEQKRKSLTKNELAVCDQVIDLEAPDARITLTGARSSGSALLAKYADGLVGAQTSDDPRYKAWFWEVPDFGSVWERMQEVPTDNAAWSGCSAILRWERGSGSLSSISVAWKGRKAWGRRGVIVARFGRFCASLYGGSKFHQNAAVVLPHDENLTPAILAFCQSKQFESEVRKIDQGMKVTNATLVKVPFDIDHWRQVAKEAGPLPEPWSADPAQWLFDGRPEVATEALQVAVGRLLGYRWPEQAESDELDVLADEDGIVCVPSVRGERTAAQRLQELLAHAYGTTWSPSRSQELISRAGSKKRDLDSWLRDDFFKAHCKVFRNRPFIWQVWDGRTDGFSALVNYHRLDRPTLEKLTYSYLGAWIERQEAAARDDVAGAEDRLAAARDLRRRLELILEGEPPYDIYVRWKSLAEQPIGWEPDPNDGVRLNVRPFVEAEVLRSRFNVKWEKDRGQNPDGSERINDWNYTRAEKEAAREGART